MWWRGPEKQVQKGQWNKNVQQKSGTKCEQNTNCWRTLELVVLGTTGLNTKRSGKQKSRTKSEWNKKCYRALGHVVRKKVNFTIL